MALIKDYIEIFENFANSKTADSWDNVGLLVGDKNKEVKGILFTLDVTEEVIDEAIENNINLIFSHHPIIFNGEKRITSGNFISDKLYKLIKNDICVYSSHTNLDKAVGGMNDTIMEVLGFDDYTAYNDIGYEYGRTCNLGGITLKDLLELIKNKLDVNYIRYTGDLNKKLQKLGVVNGAGDDFIAILEDLGCDVILTGDMKYHGTLDAKQKNLVIIDAGHFGTEWVVLKGVVKKIIKENPNAFYNLKIIFSKVSRDVFNLYI